MNSGLKKTLAILLIIPTLRGVAAYSYAEEYGGVFYDKALYAEKTEEKGNPNKYGDIVKAISIDVDTDKSSSKGTIYPTQVYFSEKTPSQIKCGEKIKLSVFVSKDAKFNMVSYSTNNEKVAYVKNGCVIGQANGTAIITVRTVNGLTDKHKITVSRNTIPLDTKMKQSCKIKNFKTVKQLPELPTGCEITALTQTLNYYGYKVNKTYMARKYLKCAPLESTTFDKAFMEDPFSENSYGCYAPVIRKAAQKYFDEHGNNHIALNFTGTNIETIYRIVNEGYPVIVWATGDMKEPERKYLWTTPKGERVIWNRGEHCMTLIGYNKIKGTVTVADPLKGKTEYNMKLFEKRYAQLGKQAVVIKESKPE